MFGHPLGSNGCCFSWVGEKMNLLTCTSLLISPATVSPLESWTEKCLFDRMYFVSRTQDSFSGSLIFFFFPVIFLVFETMNIFLNSYLSLLFDTFVSLPSAFSLTDVRRESVLLMFFQRCLWWAVLATPESVFPTCINMKNKPDANAKEVLFNTPSP